MQAGRTILAINAISIAIAYVGGTSLCHAQLPFALKRGDVVACFGGANMLHLQQEGHLEAILTDAFAQARPKFRDLSWEADTVFDQGTVIERWRPDGFGQRDEQLKRLGVTVIVAQFGRLESMSGIERLAEFTKAYERLIDAFQKQARRVVLVTPTPFEKPQNPLLPDLTRHNAALEAYVQSTAEIAKQRNLVLIDLFHDTERRLTSNGMHIKPESQAYVAQRIARMLGVKVPDLADLEPLRLAVIEKHRLWYDYWRPANWKLLYGDDSRRQFTRGGENYIPFREEWKKLVPLIAQAERRIWQIANGGNDPGNARPTPEMLHGAPNANLKTELASFSTSDGLRVNLFASEKEGLTSPLAIRWDPAGRMYVTVTTTYPHVFPGDLPNDKIIMLEDTDRDGVADKSTVFADGLNIPTGLEWGDGGLYVGQNTELLFLKDTDGDNVADQRQVVLGGFGNGDSHQTINSFVWSPDGELYFGQGDGCESRVETPWGASNLFQAGFYRFRPRRLQLHPLLDDFMGPGNPWGVAFDAWGQIFSIDGAGGVTFLSPGQIPTTHRLNLRTIGEPGGYCGIGYVESRHLPESMQGHFVIGDYKGNQVKRFAVRADGAGFDLVWKEPIIRSRHRNFRPVDVKVGPDGALYVVDWYNPVTCHQDDAYRDPTRDKAHGRIWRLSSTAETTRPIDLSTAPLSVVLGELKSKEYWTRYQAKRALTTRPVSDVARALDDWVKSLDAQHPDHEHHLYEALGAYATIEIVERGLLQRLLHAQDARARAYAARMVGRWYDRLEKPLDLLVPRVADEHPSVRLEAVMACAAIPTARSMQVAAGVIDEPMDEWIRYALKQTIHHLRSHWLPAFKRGELAFAKPNHLAAVLNESGRHEVVQELELLIQSQTIDAKVRATAIAAVLAVGGPRQWQSYGLESHQFRRDGRYYAKVHAEALARVVEAARLRDEKPDGDVGALLKPLLNQANADIQTNAITLVALWRVEELYAKVLSIAGSEKLPIGVRAAAFRSIAEMNLAEGRSLLARFASAHHSAALRSASIQSLARLDVSIAAREAAELLSGSDLEAEIATQTLAAFLDRSGGADALAAELHEQQLTADSARRLMRSLFATGRSSQVLFAALNQAIGASTTTPDFSQSLVRELADEASHEGQAQRGSLLFKSMACATCHKVAGTGGEVGPDLTSIGTTLSTERIVEEMLWPNRQIKEGYSVLQVITDEGTIVQGYERRTKESRESGDLTLKELSTGNLIRIKEERIEEKHVSGSPMPTGLTSVLSHSQLLDLIRYVSELGRID